MAVPYRGGPSSTRVACVPWFARPTDGAVAKSPIPSHRVVCGWLGGIGAGKSHVAKQIARLAPGRVVDADELALAVLLDCARDGRLQAALGPEYVRNDGTPDRTAIAKRVFNDPGALRALERLTHP